MERLQKKKEEEEEEGRRVKAAAVEEEERLLSSVSAITYLQQTEDVFKTQTEDVFKTPHLPHTSFPPSFFLSFCAFCAFCAFCLPLFAFYISSEISHRALALRLFW
jgi:hypothetical protein